MFVNTYGIISFSGMFYRRSYKIHYLRWILLCLVIILCCSSAEEEKEDEAEQAEESKSEEASKGTRPENPHIIFILADDLVHYSLAAFNYRCVKKFNHKLFRIFIRKE